MDMRTKVDKVRETALKILYESMKRSIFEYLPE